MPVTEPAVLTVLETIEERLSDLLIREVVLPSRENYDGSDEAIPPSPKDLQVTVSIGDMVRIEPLDQPGNPPRECWEVEYRLKLRIMADETDQEPIDKKAVRFVRDVRQAITGGYVYDPAWFTMNGAALSAKWGSTIARSFTDGTSQSDAYVLPLLVQVRVAPGDL